MSESGWFHAEDGQSLGPLTLEQLQERIRLGRVGPQTLLWTEGMADWLPAEQVAVYEQALRPAPEEAPAFEPIHRPSATLRPSPPDPWRRFLARQLDFLLFQYLILVAVGGINLAETEDGSVLVVVGLYFGWALIEAVLLATVGWTPGKWLMCVEVTDARGRRLRPLASLRRACDVTVRGVGMGLPFFHVFANLYGLYTLTGRGITPWDRSGGTVVTHRAMELWRWLLMLLLTFWLLRELPGLLDLGPAS